MHIIRCIIYTTTFQWYFDFIEQQYSLCLYSD